MIVMAKTVFGISGFSGSGKTTLIEKLIPLLKEKGCKVTVIKHDGHDFDVDKEGKDTFRFSAAGADLVMISSRSKYAQFDAKEHTLDQMINDADESGIVLIEGYKKADIRKIGVATSWNDFALGGDICDYDAVATDDRAGFIGSISQNADAPRSLSLFDINDPGRLAEYIANSGRDREQCLSHFDDEGNARMVDVSGKDVTKRCARAGAKVIVDISTFDLIKSKGIKKGDVLTVAQIAGIMGAKRTPDLIPMCHPVVTDSTELKLSLNEEEVCIDIESSVKCTGRTGVEMEAICACAVAAMTVYDMCKSVQRDIKITDIKLIQKSGGVHGDYNADQT